MAETVGVRELRQNLSKHLARVKVGQSLLVTERGAVVARLVPAGVEADGYAGLAARLGATVPVESLEAIAARLSPPNEPAGTTDRILAGGRRDRSGVAERRAGRGR